MMTLLRRMVVAAAVVAFYIVTAMSYRTNLPGAACFVAAISVLAFGAFVFSRSPGTPLNRAFLYLSLALGSYLLLVYLLHMATAWGIDRVRTAVWLLRNGNLLIPPVGAYFTYRFVGGRKRFLLILTYFSLLSVLPFVSLNLFGRYVSEYQLAGCTYVPGNRLHLYKFCAVATIFWVLTSWIIILVYALQGGPSRRRARLLLFLAGGAVWVVAGALAFVPAFRQPWYPSFLGIAVATFPMILGLAVLRFNLFDIKVVIRKTLPYAVGTVVIGMLYALVLSGLRAVGLRLDVLPRGTSWIVLLVLVGFGFQPTLETLHKGLDRLFFRVEAELDRFLAGAGARYGSAGSPAALARMVADDARTSLKLEGAAVLLGKEKVSTVVASSDARDLHRAQGLRMPDIVERQAVLAEEEGHLDLSADAAALSQELAGAGVEIALPFADAEGRGLLLGWRKLSDLDFGSRDVMFLQALATHAESALSRIRAEKDADVAKRLTAAVFESMTNAVALVDAEGTIRSCNPAFESTFGAGAGRSLQELGLSEVMQLGTLRGPLEIETDDGVYLANSRRLDEGTAGRTIVVVLTDVTNLRRLQETDRRRAALAEIGAVISSINHEIMNILSPVSFHLDRATHLHEPEQVDAALEVVRQRFHALDALCRELREYYREPALSLRDVRLRNVVESVLADLAVSAGSAWIAPDVGGLDLSLSADPQKLKQALLNIVKNAWEAMCDSEEKRWSIRAVAHDGKVQIEVKDSGVGITPEDMKRLFEPFFSAKREKGTGLGLPIARRIAEAHGAEIQADSRPGDGTTVTLLWPMAP